MISTKGMSSPLPIESSEKRILRLSGASEADERRLSEGLRRGAVCPQPPVSAVRRRLAMTLRELSPAYREAARLLSLRISQLRRAVKETEENV